MYTDKTNYADAPTSVKIDSTTIAYIREGNGQVITKSPGTVYDGFTTIYPLSAYLQGFVFSSTEPFYLYDFGKVNEKGLYGFSIEAGDEYTINGIESITNSGIEYQQYAAKPLGENNNLLWVGTDGTFDFVEGIGSPTRFLLMPYGGGDTSAFGWDSPQLTYVTDGEENSVIFEAKGGIKIWELGGVETVTVDHNDAPVEFFNLQGVRVDADSTTPGVYLRRQGSTATKVLVK